MDMINSITQIIIHATPNQNMIVHNGCPRGVALPIAQPKTNSTIPSINNPIYGITRLGPPEVTIACCSDCNCRLNILVVQSTIFYKVIKSFQQDLESLSTSTIFRTC